MPRNWTFCGLLALILGCSAVFSQSASAEFFGCNDRPGRVLSSSTSSHGAAAHASARTTHEFAAQSSRPRITIYPRRAQPSRNAQRQCRSWLVKEYRVSGTVVVPRQQCWWQ
ncbi:MAG: hypothetical protein EXR03_03240 [Pseudolabrys sp.]|nr:hypothetical protein [Pseudolabrys sp.]MSP31823.1 hypothetical protein [Pseudolabrys sp.]